MKRKKKEKTNERFDSVERELDALEPSELSPITVDIPMALATARAALARIDRTIPFPHLTSAIDRLEPTIPVLATAHAEWKTGLVWPDIPSSMVKSVRDARDFLLVSVKALALHGLLPADVLSTLASRALDHRGLERNVFELCVLFRVSWKTLVGKTAVTLAKIDELEARARLLVERLDAREEWTRDRARRTERRQRAFTVFARAYDEVRRSIHFLRWDNGDADAIAPAFHSARTKSSALRTGRRG